MAIIGNNDGSIDNVAGFIYTYIFFCKVVATENGNITSMRVFCKNGDETGDDLVKWVIYNSSGVLLASTTSTIPPYYGPAWKAINISVNIKNNSTYYLGAICDDGISSENPKIFNTAHASGNYGGLYSGAPINMYTNTPNPISLGDRTSISNEYLIYAIYTPSGPYDKIEGITPGKLENINWTDIVDVF